MQIAIVYDHHCPKLQAGNYSITYRDMLRSLISKLESEFGKIQYVTEDCSAKDIDANVIIFYDIHSSHHIEIEGIEKHKALKYEYFNDPHQIEVNDIYLSGIYVHKLNAEQRTKRAIDRGVVFIICPYKNGYYEYIAPHLDRAEKRLVWFPPVPKNRNVVSKKRKLQVMATGEVWKGEEGFHPYEFRRWAYIRPGVSYYPYKQSDGKRLPHGESFQQFLSGFAGALALCDIYAVPKYFEIPLAGCVCFMQHLPVCDELGFKHGENCIFVNKYNFDKILAHFKENVELYQTVADAGKKLVADNWTSEHFANHICKHIKEYYVA